VNTDTKLKKYILFLTTLAAFVMAFMGSAINIALPPIGREFNSSAVLLSWVATAYLLTTAVLLIPVGKASDIYGRVKFFKIGMSIFTVGSLLCALASSGEMLMIFRLLQGTGSAMVFTTSTAILVSAYPANERGKVIGINTTAVYAGLSSGPFLGGIISHYMGWRYIFYISFLLCLITAVIIWMKLKYEMTENNGEKFDIPGSLFYMVSLTLVMLGFTFLPGIPGIILLVSGLIALYIFMRVEEKKEFPIFNVRLFKSNRTFMFSNIAALINYSATFAISFLLSLYLQNVKGLSSQDAGFILITQPLFMALFSPLAGRISDRIEPRKVSSFGMAILTAGLVVFIFLGVETNYILIIATLAVIGFGFAMFSSPNANAIMSSVEKSYYGVAASTMSSMRMIGQMMSMGIVIVIFTLLIGKSEISKDSIPDFLKSMHFAFILFSILCFTGIFASLNRGKIHKS
jgi:EmrB/QacA subfamily drug resistance transporter